jgi:hypothetical protein
MGKPINLEIEVSDKSTQTLFTAQNPPETHYKKYFLDNRLPKK